MRTSSAHAVTAGSGDPCAAATSAGSTTQPISDVGPVAAVSRASRPGSSSVPTAADSASSYVSGSGSTAGPVTAATTLSRTGGTSPVGAQTTKVRCTARRSPPSDTRTASPRGPQSLALPRLSSAAVTEKATCVVAPGASGSSVSRAARFPGRVEASAVAQASSAERVTAAPRWTPRSTAGASSVRSVPLATVAVTARVPPAESTPGDRASIVTVTSPSVGVTSAATTDGAARLVTGARTVRTSTSSASSTAGAAWCTRAPRGSEDVMSGRRGSVGQAVAARPARRSAGGTSGRSSRSPYS